MSGGEKESAKCESGRRFSHTKIQRHKEKGVNSGGNFGAGRVLEGGMKPVWVLMAACVVLCGRAAETLPEVRTAPKRVAVFKNGLGFVVRSGEVKLREGEAELDSLPEAALGALWITTDDPAKRVLEVSSFMAKEKTPVEAVNFGELLRGNIGRVATITYAQGMNGAVAMVAGEIVAVPEDRPTAPLPVRESISARLVRPEPWRESARGELVIVRSGSETVAINKGLIQNVRFRDAELTTPVEREVQRTRVRFEPQVEAVNLSMMYLQKGWNWSPGYLVDIADEKEAQITLEAVLANDVEDLENAEVSFVVGYPNFDFADVMSPLSSRQSVAEFVQALLAHGQTRPGMDIGIITQNAVAYSGRAMLESDSYSPATLAEGQSSEDLFLFRQENVTLRKGGRARFVLFNARAPYEHVYQWNLRQVAPVNYYGRQQPRHAEEGKENEVWHTLRLANRTQQPWTTAPALTVRGQLPVAQDTLRYTPPGATNSLKITVASDIRAYQELTEVSREPVTVLSSSYMKVTVDGRLTVQNLKAVPVKMAVNREVAGEVTDAGDGVLRKLGRELNALNLSSELVWEFELEAGERKEIEFKYSTLATR